MVNYAVHGVDFAGGVLTIRISGVTLADSKEVVALIAAAPRLAVLVRQMLGCIEAGGIDSQEVEGEPEVGIPAHKWHEEWAHHARAALSEAGVSDE